MADQFTPQEQALIDRLQQAPQLRLSASKVEAIQERILAAGSAPAPVSRPRRLYRMPLPVLAVAAATVILVFLLVEGRVEPQPGATIQTSSYSATVAQAIAGPDSTVQLFATASRTATPQATQQQSETATLVSTSAVATSGKIVVVEGP